MADIRIYSVVPLSLYVKNYIQTGGIVYRFLREAQAASPGFPTDPKIVWALVSETALYVKGGSSFIKDYSALWRDLGEEDLHVFSIEEKMDGSRARELSLQPLNPMGK